MVARRRDSHGRSVRHTSADMDISVGRRLDAAGRDTLPRWHDRLVHRIDYLSRHSFVVEESRRVAQVRPRSYLLAHRWKLFACDVGSPARTGILGMEFVWLRMALRPGGYRIVVHQAARPFAPRNHLLLRYGTERIGLFQTADSECGHLGGDMDCCRRRMLSHGGAFLQSQQASVYAQRVPLLCAGGQRVPLGGCVGHTDVLLVGRGSLHPSTPQARETAHRGGAISRACGEYVSRLMADAGVVQGWQAVPCARFP